jgi:hypothetical protein
MSPDRLTAEAATSWLTDRRGKPVTLALVVDGRRQREAPGQLRDTGDGTYQVGHVTLDISTPEAYTYELRWDEAETDCLAVMLGGVEVQVRSWDTSPRIWNLADVAEELRRKRGDA